MKIDGVLCDAGHVHKNERSADDCENRRAKKKAIVHQRKIGKILPIAAEEAEHGGSYYVNRRGKAWMGR